MNKTTLLVAAVIFLLICALSVEVEICIAAMKRAEDMLKLAGLMTVCTGVSKLGELIMGKLK